MLSATFPFIVKRDPLLVKWLTPILVIFSGILFITECSHANDKTTETLDVLVWNVWRGTNEVDNGPEKALQLIKDSKADICILQESYDIKGPRTQFGPWAAMQLGWNYWQGESPHLCIITSYKIKKTFIYLGQHAIGAELEDSKGRIIHAFSIWIDWKEDVGNHLMKHPNCSDEDVLECETKRSERLEQTKSILNYLKDENLMILKTPLLVGGDFNCPSHLDWTVETANAFQYRRNLPLPVSKEMHKHGFIDSYRDIFKDPVKNPGDTWSPLFRIHDGVPQSMNRIDRLYYKSNLSNPMLKTIGATVYPEELEANEVPIRQRKFPSDHAALLINFKWKNK